MIFETTLLSVLLKNMSRWYLTSPLCVVTFVQYTLC